MLLFSSIVIWGVLISFDNVYCQDPAVDWCYDEEKNCNFIPTRWGIGFATCFGLVQSPISINFTLDVLSLTRKELYLSKAYSEEQSFTLENTGRLLILRPREESRLTGDLVAGDIFTFNSASFHYGTADNGSEHVINGNQYAMEVHLSHSNSFAGKTIMFSVLFHISDTDNAALAPITNVLEKVIHSGTQTEGSGLVLAKFLKPQSIVPTMVPIIRYPGSRTFPGCDEGIDRYVLLETKPISLDQLQIFRALQNYAEEPLGDNCRPVQPLNDRKTDYSGVSIKTEEDGLLPELLG